MERNANLNENEPTVWELRKRPANSGGSYSLGTFATIEEAMAHHKQLLKRYPRWRASGNGFMSGVLSATRDCYMIYPVQSPR